MKELNPLGSGRDQAAVERISTCDQMQTDFGKTVSKTTCLERDRVIPEITAVAMICD